MTGQDPRERLTAALQDRYRIERPLGEGGMATVYLAADLKHDRKVAIKVLKPELAAVLGAQRFLTEIRTTANLQHPHILPLFDSGEADGLLWYAMPYVEGETLRGRLDREKQLPVDEAVTLVRKVAGALQAAHDRGIVHRDMKPENILVGERGEPLVSDFGIALAVQEAGGGRLTETGLSLGTPYYMSPEQATGDRVPDARSDVYALGCVLYEMLVGDPPHTGSSAQAVLAKILTERPRPVSELRQTVPPHVGATVAKALERLPADRFDTAEAFARALDDPGFAHRTGVVGAPGGGVGHLTARRWMSLVPWAVAAAAVAFAVLRPEPPAPTPTATRVVLTMSADAAYSEAGVSRRARVSAALSPDGTEIIYRGPAAPGEMDARAPLFRRRLDGLTSAPIPGSEGWVRPAYSKDGRFIAFYVDESLGTRLGVWPLGGGAPIRLDGALFDGGSVAWGDDGALYWYDGDTELIARWVPGTAALDTVARLQEPPPGLAVTDVLPGSRAVLVIHGGDTMAAVDLATGEMTDLGGGYLPLYLTSGHLVFAREDGALMVQPFDAASLRSVGPAVSTPDAAARIGAGVAYTLADDGSLLYLEGDGGVEALALADRTGKLEPLAWIEPSMYRGVSLSPDGRRLAAAQGTFEGADLWVFDLQDRTRLRVTQDRQSSRPVWHPREPRLLFVHDGSGPGGLEVWTLPADGSSPGTPVVAFSGAPADVVPEPDGRGMILRMPSETSLRSIFRYVPGETEQPVPLVVSTFFDMAPAPSPDGRWLAYQSNRSGRGEVYARPHPDGGAVVPISLGGGGEPVWSRDGRELFYVTDDRWLWSARVEYDANALRVVERTRLFELRGRLGAGARANYDVTPDGRFLLVQGAETNRQLVLVRNWAQSVTGGDPR